MTMQPDNLGPLAAALAKAQAEFPVIERTRTVTVQTKTGGKYTFSYAPLDTILAAVRAPLSAHGLAVTQLLDGPDLVTILMHESGGFLEGRHPLPHANGDTVQQLGSTITYLRRYALQAVLGVASEEDDDGNAAAGHRATPTARRTDVDRSTGEILPQRTNGAHGPSTALVEPSDADVERLHAQFSGSPIAPAGGLSTVELFNRAEQSDVSKAQLTVAAKALFGASRWKVADLSDEERQALWEEVAP